MFTLTQIQEAHSKVKSGADFPAYVQALNALGVRYYHTYVYDGHTEYVGTDAQSLTAPANYPQLVVAEGCDPDQFRVALQAHQQGKTDYPTFRADCARFGIDKWTVRLDQRTCTYYDNAGAEVLLETIPG